MTRNSKLLSSATALLLSGTMAFSFSGSADQHTVYSNDFEKPDTAFQGLTLSGTLAHSRLTVVTLPTDSAGISSPQHSKWLGKLGANVPKSKAEREILTLSLNDLVPNAQYSVSFDLLIGASWDGSASGYGPDEWKLTARSGALTATLVDATFSNCAPSICGANSPQTYSKATPRGGVSKIVFPAQTGAEASSVASQASAYAIYRFGSGSGNPILTFTAGASTATLRFERMPIASQDSADEYWALDNIVVTGPSGEATPGSADSQK